MKRLLYIVPIVAFGILAYFLFASLNGAPPDQLPSALVDKPSPPITLPPLDKSATAFSRNDLTSGDVTVMIVWASWCVPCRLEAPMLDRLKAVNGVALYGLVYKDRPEKARAFLNEV